MAKNTTYFNGIKLREGREARGLTVTSLAELLGVTKQSLSFYETGQQLPRFELVEKMSELLNLPMQFFTPAGEEEEFENTQFRSRKSAADLSRQRAKRKLKWMVNIVQYLKTTLDFPKVDVPHLQDIGPLSLSDIQVGYVAKQLRDHWQIGSKIIGNLTGLFESKGIIIGYVDLMEDSLEGLSRWNKKDKTPYIMINREMGSAARKRLTLAYELGRIVLHRYVTEEQLSNSTNRAKLEKQAYVFGSSFLMPSDSFMSDFYIPSLDVFKSLKEKWQVSIAAMIHRSSDLGLLDAERSKNIWMTYARKGWKQLEPYEDKVYFEEPHLIRSGMNQLLEGSYLSASDLLSNIPYSLTDIEELSSIPRNSLKREAKKISTPSLKSEQTVTVGYVGDTTILQLNNGDQTQSQTKSEWPKRKEHQGNLGALEEGGLLQTGN